MVPFIAISIVVVVAMLLARRVALSCATLSPMKYLLLIHLNESELDAMPSDEMDALNTRHIDLNEDLRRNGHIVEAQALQPGRTMSCVRIRNGKTIVTDGPFTESKELVAGFYLIEARDQDEANQIASRIPSASLGTVEVRQVRQLVLPDGRTS